MPIACLVSKVGCNVYEPMQSMLSTMRHHEEAEAYAVVGNRLISGRDEAYNLPKNLSSVGVGWCGFKIGVTKPSKQSIDLEDGKPIVFEGRIYDLEGSEKGWFNSYGAQRGLTQVSSLLRAAVNGEACVTAFKVSKAMKRLRGSFSLAIMDGGRIVVARDVIGIEPLYWGENERHYGLASERKALWRIGIKKVSSFPPGHVAIISNKGVIQRRAMALERPEVVDISLEEAAAVLLKNLQRVFKLYTRCTGQVGVLFSGGVDSCLIAKCIVDQGFNPILYVAGFEDSHDVEVAERSADELGCRLHKRIISYNEVEGSLTKVIYAVEECDLMKIGIGLPLYMASEAAADDKIGNLFTGQGADELFGGYWKYCRIIKTLGVDRLSEELWRDVLNLAQVNLQRDKGIASANNIDLLLPFSDLDLINTALSFPTRLKVEGPNDVLRKHVIRKAAKLLSLPEDIAIRPKKAMQYGSGTHKAIRSIAKSKGYRSSQDYLNSIFNKAFKEIVLKQCANV